MCSIDLEKAFDGIHLIDIIHLLYQGYILYRLAKIIEIKINGELIEPIDTHGECNLTGGLLKPATF